VFKRKANEYVEYIREVFPAVEAQLNPDKPRKGAFNISVQVSNVQCKAFESRLGTPMEALYLSGLR
jgi:hypothetical protein